MLAVMLFAATPCAQTILVDSIISTTDSLGITIYQRYTEIETEAGGYVKKLSDPQDSATFVNQTFSSAHNNYVPLTAGYGKVLSAGEYNSEFNLVNNLLSTVGLSYWDMADAQLSSKFTGLWRVIDVAADTTAFYEAFTSNDRLLFRQVDVSFSRDPDTGKRYFNSTYVDGSRNQRMLIRNRRHLRSNFEEAGVLEIIYLKDLPNKENSGYTRKVFVDTSGNFRFVHFSDFSKI